MEKFKNMNCRKCNIKNPVVFLAPVYNTCICYNCALKKGWINKETGNLKKGVEL